MRHRHDSTRASSAIRFLAGLLLLLAAGAAGAQAPGAPVGAEQIARLVEQQVQEALAGSGLVRGASAVEVRSGALDSRLRLAACESPLRVEADLSRPAGRINAKVQCAGTAPWSIYVPVEIHVFRAVVVSTRPLVRGQPIGTADVTLEERDVLAGGGHLLLALEDAIGRSPRRNLPANTPLTASSVEMPVLVRRGEHVSLAARAGGITVTATGEALSDGRSGEQIRVRNLQSRRVVEATVTGQGRAEVI